MAKQQILGDERRRQREEQRPAPSKNSVNGRNIESSRSGAPGEKRDRIGQERERHNVKEQDRRVDPVEIFLVRPNSGNEKLLGRGEGRIVIGTNRRSLDGETAGG